VASSIPENGSILDVDYGMGEPIAKFFIDKNFQLTGIDASEKMIALCRQRFPKQTWIVSDMKKLKLNQTFDAVITWHSLWWCNRMGC